MLAHDHRTYLSFWPILFLQVDLIRCQGCLELAEPCTATGTLGNCCSSYCHQILGQPLGSCQLQNVTWDTMARRTTTTTMKPPSGAIEAASTTILIAVSVVLAVLVGITAVAILFMYKYFQTKSQQRELTEEEIKEFRDGNPKAAQRANGSEKAFLLPFADEFAIPSGGLIIDRDAVLGEGEYGIVWSGHLYKQPVAVKTVKEKADVDCVKAFLKELKIQAYIGKHPHIVEFYGAEISQLRERIVYAVVELSPEGNLLSYLRANSQYYFHTIQDGLQIQSANQTNLTENAQFDSETVSVSLSLKQYENVETRLKTSNLLRWCAQIAEAMAFLGEKKVIHGDLATRNVLVFNKDLVKVSDFGLSRQLYQSSQYVKKQAAPLPWRWMAIESLKLMEFSSQSDVWSFGVTAWEIFSFGNAPFPGLSWTLDVVEKLEKGLRMTRPKFMNQQIYDMLLDCWRLHPADRPVFTEIHKCFQNLLDTFIDRETSTENA